MGEFEVKYINKKEIRPVSHGRVSNARVSYIAFRITIFMLTILHRRV
jgi:hypothetical protein